MKIAIPGSLLLLSVLITGCGEKMPNASAGDSANQLTAADLAQLTDYHAWSVPIPEAQRPVKAIRLVFFNRGESTVTQQFSTGDNLGTNCISFLLGLRAEHGRLSGRLFTKDSDGHGLGWNLDFADPFGNSDTASPVPGTVYWSTGWTGPGTLAWNGNRAEFATRARSNVDCVLAVELEK